MDRTQKIDCGTNGEVIFTGATIKFQLKEGLTRGKRYGLSVKYGAWYLSRKANFLCKNRNDSNSFKTNPRRS